MSTGGGFGEKGSAEEHQRKDKEIVLYHAGVIAGRGELEQAEKFTYFVRTLEAMPGEGRNNGSQI